MRINVFAMSLVVAIILVISRQYLGRGAPSISTFIVIFVLQGLGWISCMSALLALLGHRPPRRGDKSELKSMTDNRRDKAPVLLMVACASLILHMLIGSLSSGSVAPLLGRYPVPVYWDTNPKGFVIHIFVWAALCWVLGWRMPRKILRKQAGEDGADG